MWDQIYYKVRQVAHHSWWESKRKSLPVTKTYQFHAQCACASVNKRISPMATRPSRTAKGVSTDNLPAPTGSWFVLRRVFAAANAFVGRSADRPTLRDASQSPPILLSEYEIPQNEPIFPLCLPPFDSAQGEVRYARSAKNRFTCVILAKASFGIASLEPISHKNRGCRMTREARKSGLPLDAGSSPA